MFNFSTLNKFIQTLMMLRYALLLPIVVLFLFVGAGEGLAQSENTTQNTLLPEIDPQDIEIRSEFKARFPGLRRQPILGFDPQPRVFQIDPNRKPFMETREEVVANVPVSQLSRPAPPLQDYINIPERYSGFLRAGFGRFTTPELQGFYTHLFNPTSLLTGALDFSSSDGHLDQQASSFRFFNAGVEYLTRPAKDLQLDFRLSANSDFNYLAGFDKIAADETPKKDYTGLSGNFKFTKMKNQLDGWKGMFDFDLFAVDQEDFPSAGFGRGELNEQTAGLFLERKWTGKRLFESFNISAEGRFGNADMTGTTSQQWADIRTGVTYARTFNYQTKLETSAGIAYLTDEFDDKFYIEPEIKLTHSFNERLELSGSVYGLPEIRSHRYLHNQNRFIGFLNGIRQSYRAGASGEFSLNILKGSKIYGGASYELINDYAFFLPIEFSDLSGINFASYFVNYQDADIFKLFAGVNHQLVPEKFWLNAEGYFRSPKLDAGGDIPFEEKTGASLSVSFKPVQQILLESWTEFIGERENAITGENELNSFLLLNFKAEATIINGFGFYVKFLNILDEEYEVWRGYEERPLQILGGITYKF